MSLHENPNKNFSLGFLASCFSGCSVVGNIVVSRITILFLVSAAVALLSGCSIKGSIEEFTDGSTAPIEILSRVNPDFINGEVITSSSGHQAIGVFGEASEKATSTNSYQMEGAFYE